MKHHRSKKKGGESTTLLSPLLTAYCLLHTIRAQDMNPGLFYFFEIGIDHIVIIAALLLA